MVSTPFQNAQFERRWAYQYPRYVQVWIYTSDASTNELWLFPRQSGKRFFVC